MQTKRVVVVVLDSVGVGAMPDAADYLDEGANTLAHVAASLPGFSLPTMQSLGLGCVLQLPGVPSVDTAKGAFGKMAEKSPAKDTTTGHWELMGLVSTEPFRTFHDGFPPEIIDAFVAQTGYEILGNKPASGTAILEELGPEHLASGKLIVYTSADSVFQIAAHEELVPLPELYRVCRIARSILDPYKVARVISRPFVGRPGAFQRTYNRKDFSMEPHGLTLLDHLVAEGIPVVGVGKIGDIFADRGVPTCIHTEGNADGMRRTTEAYRDMESGLLFTNLVDFDMAWGHRRNPQAYAKGLMEADAWLGHFLEGMGDETTIYITADHGCDPTFLAHTDHTREYVPILAAGAEVPAGRNLGVRNSFGDLAATVAGQFGVKRLLHGSKMF